MTLPPLHPALLSYLHDVQQTTLVGTNRFLRHRCAPSRTTMYRWRRTVGAHLLAVPSIQAEAFGLLHAHAIVTKPGPAWLRSPYAIEASFGTKDFSTDVLYLHLLVPAVHQRWVGEIMASLPCEHVAVIWSGTGWQQFITPETVIAIPRAVLPADEASTVLLRQPLAIPALAESWEYPNSLPAIWSRITARLGEDGVRRYVGRWRIKRANGKQYVREAFDDLSTSGVIVQHVVRYQPLLASNTEVFLTTTLGREALGEVFARLRQVLRIVETYPTPTGYLCRLLGTHDLLDVIIALPEEDRARLQLLCFHAKRFPGRVRFRYEELFDPTTASWKTARWDS